jgi:hypothetical protein
LKKSSITPGHSSTQSDQPTKADFFSRKGPTMPAIDPDTIRTQLCELVAQSIRDGSDKLCEEQAHLSFMINYITAAR